MRRTITSAALAIFLASLTLGLRAASITITPGNPTILVNQAVQLTATGAVVPVAVSAGATHTCLFFSDQSVRCAGNNGQGQVGDGTLAMQPTPVAVNLANARSVPVGMEHSCSLIGDGTMQCWGSDYTGQLGDERMGNGMLAPAPVAVHQMTTAIKAITGGWFTCAILADHTVSCWGRNQDGQLGNGDSTTDTALPGPVSGLGAVADLVAGRYHTCALMSDTTVRCWGRNGRGQVGNGNDVSPQPLPVPVSGLSNVATLSLGGYHSCALMADRTVQCWGQNDQGQIGDPNVAFSSVPDVVQGISNVKSLSAGFLHTCVVLADGTVRCWGLNDYGELGDGTTTTSRTPVAVNGISGATSVSAGGYHTCALLADSSVWCWGEGNFGELGNGAAVNSTAPVKVAGTGMTWTSSDPSIATVDATGLVTGVARGTTTITVTDASGNSASTPVTVKEMLTLAALRQGDGGGTVTSTPAGITCGTTCSATFLSDSSVTLTAAPNADSNFAGWTGCDSVSGASCTVSMASARSVNFIFMLKRFTLAVTKSGLGKGTVTSNPAGINCGTACASDYVINTSVTLTATPAMLSIFNGWTGCDAVNGSSCTVAITRARSVDANFLGVPLP